MIFLMFIEGDLLLDVVIVVVGVEIVVGMVGTVVFVVGAVNEVAFGFGSVGSEVGIGVVNWVVGIVVFFFVMSCCCILRICWKLVCVVVWFLRKSVWVVVVLVCSCCNVCRLVCRFSIIVGSVVFVVLEVGVDRVVVDTGRVVVDRCRDIGGFCE